ncbi:MAG TPA: PQQ-dependent sugar dehydrogenase [Acidimicrobiales bacterium]
MASAFHHHRSARTRSAVAVITLAMTLALVAGACTGDEGDAAPTTTTSPPPTTAPTTTTIDAAGQALIAAFQDTSIRLDPVIPNGLDYPTAMVQRPGRNQWWIAERPGRIRVATVNSSRNRATGEIKQEGITLLPGAVLDISSTTSTDGERGLLGIAFSTDGRTLYVDHTSQEGDVVVAAYAVEDLRAFAGPGTPPPVATVVKIDPASRVELLDIEHKENTNHNGGQLVLGPDGYLYIGVGDGGGTGDPENRAQDKDSLLGKILRIDPAGGNLGQRYAVPPDNPFVAGGGRPEIHLYGVRNPWRFSFDRETGALWVADVGQGAIEEINRLPADTAAGRGANLGWSWFEGDQRFRPEGTPPRGLVKPLHTYDHSEGRCSITGGFVYRGVDLEDELGAVYVYGDYCTGEIRGLLSRQGVVLADRGLGAGAGQNGLVSFAQDEQGELYVLAANGSISKIVR